MQALESCLLSQAALWNALPNPNNAVNSKHRPQKDPKHVFFRSLLLFSCHTSMQDGHPLSVSHTHTARHGQMHIHAHIHTTVSMHNYTQTTTPTTEQSPLAPTHLMFSQYYVKTDTHNCAGMVPCFCWLLSMASVMSLTEVIAAAGTTDLHHCTCKYAASMRSCWKIVSGKIILLLIPVKWIISRGG